MIRVGDMDAKPLIIVILFVFIIAIIASGIIGDVNLTDSGTTQPMAASSGEMNYDVFSGNSSSSSSGALPGTTGGQPVTGGGKSTSPLNSPCGSTYIVQSGDTLSKIARTCLISIEDMLAVNPNITNPNYIVAGQKITIFKQTLPVVTTTKQITRTPTAKAAVTKNPKPTNTATAVATAGPEFVATVPPGLKPGQAFKIEVRGFPAYAELHIGIGLVGKTPSSLKTALTDENGRYATLITIPNNAKAGEKWTVTVKTTAAPQKKITTVPFEISK
jgi:LysM repeat protein